MNIKIGLSSDRTNLALANPGTVLKDFASCVGMNIDAVRHMQLGYKNEKRIKVFCIYETCFGKQAKKTLQGQVLSVIISSVSQFFIVLHILTPIAAGQPINPLHFKLSNAKELQ